LAGNKVEPVAQRRHLGRAALLTVWISDKLERKARA
jgi:hypothetical protein